MDNSIIRLYDEYSASVDHSWQWGDEYLYKMCEVPVDKLERDIQKNAIINKVMII